MKNELPGAPHAQRCEKHKAPLCALGCWAFLGYDLLMSPDNHAFWFGKDVIFLKVQSRTLLLVGRQKVLQVMRFPHCEYSGKCNQLLWLQTPAHVSGDHFQEAAGHWKRPTLSRFQLVSGMQGTCVSHHEEALLVVCQDRVDTERNAVSLSVQPLLES